LRKSLAVGWSMPAPMAAAAAGLAAGAAELPEAAPLVAEPGGAGAGLAYRGQRPMWVPADGGPHKTMVARFELDAALDHLVVPALAAEAYLRATVTNTSSLLLLPGPARVFHGTGFVGQTALETVAAGEEFELQLGVDDQIRGERELRRRSTSKAVIRGSRTLGIAHQITVGNHRGRQAPVRAPDHNPRSSDRALQLPLRQAT